MRGLAAALSRRPRAVKLCWLVRPCFVDTIHSSLRKRCSATRVASGLMPISAINSDSTGPSITSPSFWARSPKTVTNKDQTRWLPNAVSAFAASDSGLVSIHCQQFIFRDGFVVLVGQCDVPSNFTIVVIAGCFGFDGQLNLDAIACLNRFHKP